MINPFTRDPIAVLDPDSLSRSSITNILSTCGFDPVEVTDYHDAFYNIRYMDPSLIVLNWEIPELSGSIFIPKLRSDPKLGNVPIMAITECCDTKGRIECLENGADDCMSKPLSPHELALRVVSLLRRSNNLPAKVPKNTLKIKDLELDASSLSLRVNGENYHLSASNFRLLHYLMSRRGEVVTREDLCEVSTGGTYSDIGGRTVDVYIMRLRKTLKQYGQEHLIQTVRGIGYRLVV